MSVDHSTASILQEAEEIVAAAQRAIDATDAFFRDQGLDPAKAREFLARLGGEHAQAEAEAAVAADLAAADQEAAEELARRRFAAAPAALSQDRPDPLRFA